MFVFILANLPLPFIVYLNWRVTTKLWRVHRLAKYAKVEKPRRLVAGWWLNTASGIFVLIPVLSERRVFIQDRHWLVSFATAAVLTITGLLLMNNALNEELRQLTRKRRATTSR